MGGVGIFRLPKTGTPPATTAFPLRVRGRYLEDQNGKPFPVIGDAAWSLIAQLSKAQALSYIHDRQARGFNTLVVSLLEHKFASNAPNNLANDAPFSTPGDFTTPNSAYFVHADWVIQQAQACGMLIILTPMYLGYQMGDEGWGQELLASSVGNCTSYGQFLGTRYASFPNIMWMHGGDVNANDYTGALTRVNAIANGIKGIDATKLHTAHSARHRMAVTDYNQSWLDVNTVYSDKTDGLTESQDGYTSFLSTGKPAVFIEGTYENEAAAPTTVELRSQVYWPLIAGLAGTVFGNCPIWHFSSDIWGFCSSGLDWQTELASAGAQSMIKLANHFRGVRWHDMVPDSSHLTVTAGYSTDASAMMTADRQQLLAYFPSSRAVTVNLSRFAGAQVYVTWLDPATGGQATEGVFAPSAGSVAFTPPYAGDWVLRVMDVPVTRRWFYPMENIAEFSLFETQPACAQELSTTQVHGGRFSHRGYATAARGPNNDGANAALPHRAYPYIYRDNDPIKTPCKITLLVWTDVTLVDRSPGLSDWFSFATFSCDVLWARVLTVNLRLDTTDGKYYVYAEHVPNFGESIPIYQASHSGGLAFSRSQWVKIEMYLDFDNDHGSIRVFQDGTLVNYSLVNNGNGHVFRDHYGFYGSAALPTGTQVFNDDLLVEEFAV